MDIYSNLHKQKDYNQNVHYKVQSTIYDKLIEFCLIFLIIFTPFAYGAVQTWSIALFEAIAALMFLFWFLKMLTSGKFEFVHNPIIFLVFLFIPYVFLQFFISRYAAFNMQQHTLPNSIYPWVTKIELLKVISYALIFLVILNSIKSRQQIARILSVIITVGFLMGIFFIMRYFGARAPRGIINPDHFSGYLGMIIPLALGLIFIPSLTVNRYTLYAKRFLLFFCAIVMSTALFFTMSRGGMFSFITGLLVMAGLLLTRKSIKKKGWILSAVVIFIILTIAWLGATPVIEKILSIKVEIASLYFGGRLPIWQGTLEIIKDYPVFGTGFGTFNYIFPKYQPSNIIKKHYSYAHSDFLELLSETGFIGFSLFAVCILVSAVWLIHRFSKRHDPFVICLSIGFLGSLSSIFVHSFTDFNLHIPANAILISIILALFISILNYKHDNIYLKKPLRYQIAAARYPFFNMRCSLCIATVVLMVLYITASARPAMADYYSRNTKDDPSLFLPLDKGRIGGVKNIKLAIALDPANAAYHYRLGKLYSTQHEKYAHMQDILDEYKKAVELNPTNSKYHQSLAWAYGQLSDLLKLSSLTYRLSPEKCRESAHKEFREAIRLEPNNPYRYRSYAIWLSDHPTEENIKKMESAEFKVIELAPGLADESFDRYYKLAKDYRLLKRITPKTYNGYILLGNYLFNRSQSEQAITLLNEGITIFPENKNLLLSLREHYEKNQIINHNIKG